MRLQQALNEAIDILKQNNKQSARVDAKLLLQHVLACDSVYLILNQKETLSDNLYNQYKDLIQQRVKGKPLQHLLGEWEFMGLPFKVNENALIPRQETETLIELALQHLPKKPSIVMDIGTGSGCIPISLCYYNKAARCIGVDYSADALVVARENGNINNVNDKITWIKSNLFDRIDKIYYGKVDMIISNPPYIKTKDIDNLMVEVRDYEPRMALDGGRDGLDFYRKISQEARKFLSEEGMIIYEIGHDQADDVMVILEDNKYKNITYKEDLYGIKRIIYANF